MQKTHPTMHRQEKIFPGICTHVVRAGLSSNRGRKHRRLAHRPCGGDCRRSEPRGWRGDGRAKESVLRRERLQARKEEKRNQRMGAVGRTAKREVRADHGEPARVCMIATARGAGSSTVEYWGEIR